MNSRVKIYKMGRLAKGSVEETSLVSPELVE